jgi:hypothetical protein
MGHSQAVLAGAATAVSNQRPELVLLRYCCLRLIWLLAT